MADGGAAEGAPSRNGLAAPVPPPSPLPVPTSSTPTPPTAAASPHTDGAAAAPPRWGAACVACALNMGGILHGLLVALGRRAGLGLRRRRLWVGLGAGRAVLRPAHNLRRFCSVARLLLAVGICRRGLACGGGWAGGRGRCGLATGRRVGGHDGQAGQLHATRGTAGVGSRRWKSTTVRLIEQASERAINSKGATLHCL